MTGFIRSKSKYIALALMSFGAAVPAFATTDSTTGLTDAATVVTNFSTATASYLNASVPVILAIFGLFLAVGILMGWGKHRLIESAQQARREALSGASLLLFGG